MDEETEKIIRQIVDETDLGREEVTEKIERKQEELSGFITAEGAANIVARNQGITPEREEPEVRKLLIEDLSEGMSNVDIVGRVSRIFEPREFERKDGSKGKVANIVLMDKTGEIRTVLWGKMSKLVSEREIQKGDIIQIRGAYIKRGQSGNPELHLGRRGQVEVHPDDERTEDLPSLSDVKIKIADLDSNLEFVDIVGRVIAVTAPREFERSDKSVGKVSTLRIIDETGQSRVSVWGDKADQVEDIEQGDAVKLESASVREGLGKTPELHIDWRSRIVKSPEPEEVEKLPEFEKKLLKIEEIEPDMPVLSLAAKVQRTFPVKEFDREDGSSGRVMNVVLSDETGTIRASFWDEMVDDGKKLSPGDVILLENARSALGLRDRPEVRIGRSTKIKINPESIEIGEMKPTQIKLSGLEEGLESIEVAGRVVNLSEVKEFTRSNKSEGKVSSFTLGDDTGTARVTLWGSKADMANRIEEGDIVKIEEAYSVSGNYGPEIHTAERSKVRINPSIEEDIPPLENIEKKVTDQTPKKIDDAEENTQIKIRGTVVQILERDPIFKVCPQCGRKVAEEDIEAMCEKCEEVVEPENRVVVNVIVDDGSENIRVVAFGEPAEKLLGGTTKEISEVLKREDNLSKFYGETDLVGREITVEGGVKRDDYFDQLEIRAKAIGFPEPIEETKRILEKLDRD